MNVWNRSVRHSITPHLSQLLFESNIHLTHNSVSDIVIFIWMCSSTTKESSYKGKCLVTSWIPGTHSISHRIISYMLDFIDRNITLCWNWYKYEHQGTRATQDNFLKHSLPWFNVPCWPENKWCQINKWLGLHVVSFLQCQSASTTPWDWVFRVRPWYHGSLCTTVRCREACSAQWYPGPKGTKACEHCKQWGMLA
jgi:hypothetical protein